MRRLGVALHAMAHDDRFGAAAHRFGHRHRGVDAELARFVRARRDDAAARRATDENRLAAQLRIIALLDGRVERVEVDVEDRAHYETRKAYRTRVTRMRIATSAAINRLHCHCGAGVTAAPRLILPSRARTMPCTDNTPSTTTVSLM